MLRAKLLFGFSLAMVLVARTAAASSLSFPLNLPADRLHVEKQGALVTIRVDDRAFDLTSDPGQPVLPYRIVGVLLPQGEDVARAYVDAGAERALTSSAGLERAQAMLSEEGKTGTAPALLAMADGVYPSTRVRFLSTGTLHGYRIATFAVYPLRIDGDQVMAADQLTLHIETAASTAPAPVTLQRRSPDVRARALEELSGIVVNAGDASRYAFNEVAVAPRRGFQPTAFPSLEGSSVSYVIVTPDSLAATYQALAEFNTAKGVPTVGRPREWD